VSRKPRFLASLNRLPWRAGFVRASAAWSSSILGGAFAYGMALVAKQAWEGDAMGPLPWVMLVITITLAAIVPRGWGIAFGVLAMVLVVFTAYAYHLIWQEPPASCRIPQVTCESSNGDLPALLLAATMVFGGVVGSVLRVAWRDRPKPEAAQAP
jgi:hypothetical protein